MIECKVAYVNFETLTEDHVDYEFFSDVNTAHEWELNKNSEEILCGNNTHYIVVTPISNINHNELKYEY